MVENWLRREDIKMLVYSEVATRYTTLIEKQPEWFEKTGGIENILIYKVILPES